MKKIYYNGTVYTGVPGEKANYVITEGNKITGVGYSSSNEDVERMEGEKIDLKGGMLLPGFCDAHAHPFTSAFQQSQIVNNFNMTESDVLDNTRDYIMAHPEKTSFFGAGHSEIIFGEEGPKKQKLDAICSDRPVILMGCGGHDAWVNSKALEAAGVDRNHPDPIPGSQFYRRDASGDATGHLLEFGPMSEVITAVDPFVEEEAEARLKEIFDHFAESGITTIGDCGIISYLEDKGRSLLDKCIAEKSLKHRIFGSNQILERHHVNGWYEHLSRLRDKYDDDNVRIRTFKLVNDGTIESRSAAMIEPFIGDSKPIDPLFSGQEYIDLCVDVARKGFDLHLHGIGDRANHENLMAAVAVREAGYLDTRITNAHSQYVPEEDLKLFSEYNIIANSTATWFYGDDDPKSVVGDRADRTFLMKTIADSGAVISFGSDYPGDEYGIETLHSIETGVTRQMLGEPDSLILKPESERLSVEEMIKGHTQGPAYAFRMEDKLGKIRPGMYADFVILAEDIFNTPKYEIHDIPVVMTVMDGRIMYGNNNA